MLDLKSVVHAILEDYALPWGGTHGVPHWARVLENGMRLAKVNAVRIEVVQLFAVLHDSCRMNEGVDDGHGQRGAELVARLRGQLFDLDDHDSQLLYEACAHHTDGLTDGDITIQTCWDADRLDLGRVGTPPNPKGLCTAAAKRPDILAWADGRGAFETAARRSVTLTLRQGRSRR